MQFKMVHGDDDRDSLLYFLSNDVLDLVLQYRIQLVRVEPTTKLLQAGHQAPGDGTLLDDEGKTFNLQAWQEWEWQAFRNSFAQVVTDFWSGVFELTPNRPWFRRTEGEKLTAPRVVCDLSVDVLDTPARAHHRYYIIKPTEDWFRSWAWRERRIAMLTDRDLTPEVDRIQTRVKRRRFNVSYFQTTVLHEFGHTLGFHHVGGRSNAVAAYGITLDERSSLMGAGDKLGPGYAQPWIEQMRRHLIRHGEQPLKFRVRIIKEQSPSSLYIEYDPGYRPPA